MIRLYRYARYRDRLELSGGDLTALSGQPKAMAGSLIPALRETSAMSRRVGLVRTLRAMNGEIADEVHEFEDVRHGAFRLKRLLLRGGRVIELMYRW
jgi:hypothetical protein